MFQINAPKKVVSTTHFWASVLLIVLALVFSFMPIISLDLSMPEVSFGEEGVEIADMGSDIRGDVEEMIGEIFGITDLEIPEKVDVSLPKLVGSVSLIFKVVGAMGDTEDAAAKQAELDEYLNSESGKQDVVTAIAIAASFMKVFDFESLGENFNIMSFLLNTLVTMIGLFAVLALVVIIPIKLIIAGIKTIITVIRVLKNKENPELYCATVAGILPAKITLVFTLMLFQCVVPGMTYGWGVLAICILGIIAIALNFVATRVRKYPNEQFIYLNIVQGGALVGMIGFLVFFFNIVKSGIFKAFVGGNLATYLGKVIEAAVAEVPVNTSYIVDVVMMLVYLVIMLTCTKFFDKTAKRFSCTVKKGLISNKPKDSGIVGACILFLAYLLPTLVAGFKHYYADPTVTSGEGDASLLILSANQEAALGGALAGIIIMILAEVAIIVLKNVFCKNLTAEAAQAVIDGSIADVEPIVAEAPAAEEVAVAAEETTNE